MVAVGKTIVEETQPALLQEPQPLMGTLETRPPLSLALVSRSSR